MSYTCRVSLTELKKTGDKGGGEQVAGTDGATAEFFDQADVTALVAPGSVNHRGVESPASQPPPLPARLGIVHALEAFFASTTAAQPRAIAAKPISRQGGTGILPVNVRAF